MLFTQTCDQIWLSLLSLPRASLSLSRSVFAQSLTSVVQERDETCVAAVLSTNRTLGLYNRMIECTEFKDYLLRHDDGHWAAMIRFQLRSRTSMLEHHLPSRYRDHHSRDVEEGPSGCPTCRSDDDDLVEDFPHALFCYVAHAHHY